MILCEGRRLNFGLKSNGALTALISFNSLEPLCHRFPALSSSGSPIADFGKRRLLCFQTRCFEVAAIRIKQMRHPRSILVRLSKSTHTDSAALSALGRKADTTPRRSH